MSMQGGVVVPTQLYTTDVLVTTNSMYSLVPEGPLDTSFNTIVCALEINERAQKKAKNSRFIYSFTKFKIWQTEAVSGKFTCGPVGCSLQLLQKYTLLVNCKYGLC